MFGNYVMNAAEALMLHFGMRRIADIKAQRPLERKKLKTVSYGESLRMSFARKQQTTARLHTHNKYLARQSNKKAFYRLIRAEGIGGA